MELLERYPGLPVQLLGSVALAFAVAHFLADDDPAVFDLAESGVIVLLSGSLFYGGYRATRDGLTPEEGLRVVAVALAFGLVGFLVTAFVVTIRFLEGQPVGEEQFFLFASGTAGAAVGTPLGHYYNRLQTRRRELERQYEYTTRLNKRLAVTERVLRHNLRNELTVLFGCTQICRDAVDDSTVCEYLDRTERHLERIRDLSATARRLEKVWDEDATDRLELVEFVADCVDGVRASAPPAVTVRTDLPETAPATAHPRFGWAVEELLGNAVEHNDPDGLVVEVRVDPGPETVTVDVADTGSGVPAIETEALFQPEETPLEHGTGLGLWLVYWIVEKSGGDVAFEPNEPTGTVVLVELPRAN